MNTECTPKQLELQGLGKRKIVVSNDGELSTSDGGLILLQQIEKNIGLSIVLFPVSRTSEIRAEWSTPFPSFLSRESLVYARGMKTSTIMTSGAMIRCSPWSAPKKMAILFPVKVR